MKRKDLAVYVGMLMGLVYYPSSAADSNLNDKNTPRRDRDRDTTISSQPHHLNNLDRDTSIEQITAPLKASDIVGLKVVNLQNEDLGKVSELGVDVEAGRVAVVIIQSGGVFGLGAKNIAVPPRSFSYDHANKHLLLDIDKERFKNADSFEISKWEDVSTTDALSKTYRYHRQQPYFQELDDTRNQSDITRTPKTDGIRTTTDPNRPANDLNAVPSDNTRNSQGESSRVRVTKLGHIEKSSKVIGMAVINKANDKCGDVDNLIVDLPMGRLVHIVVSSGGFLGLGDTLNAIPPSEFTYSADHDKLVLDATKEQLTQAPNFKKSDWPNFKDPQYSGKVYRSYGATPYFQTDADNTARNVRDRQGNTPTPLDQGNSESDLQTTKQIRQALMDEKGLSVNARNIKVITANGKVTLRGPVNDTAEKEKVTAVVNRITQNAEFDNQIEVKREGSKE